MTVNEYDHEDAFKAANRCAGRYVKLADAIKFAESKDQARLIILDCQERYQFLFDAFIEGVAWGRENPRVGNGT